MDPITMNHVQWKAVMAGFGLWLRAGDPYALVGWSASPTDCPIATYLNDVFAVRDPYSFKVGATKAAFIYFKATSVKEPVVLRALNLSPLLIHFTCMIDRWAVRAPLLRAAALHLWDQAQREFIGGLDAKRPCDGPRSQALDLTLPSALLAPSSAT